MTAFGTIAMGGTAAAGTAAGDTADYDVIVVGAGFAGLACARRAAERGLSALVLERQSEPGERIHTTGILVKEAWEEWAAPEHLVRRINRVRVYDPRHRFVELERDSYFFMATDTAGLLRHLVEETRRAGAEIRFGAPYEGALGAGSDATCRFLVGADGARSRVAESFGLDTNRRLLKGVEWEYEPRSSDGDCLHCFIDPERAPGYIAWVVPGVAATQVGLAVHLDRRADMARFVARVDPLFGLSGRRVLEKRGGVIPIGGLPVRQAGRGRDRGPSGRRPPSRSHPPPRVSEPHPEARRPLGLRPSAGRPSAGSGTPGPNRVPETGGNRVLPPLPRVA